MELFRVGQSLEKENLLVWLTQIITNRMFFLLPNQMNQYY